MPRKNKIIIVVMILFFAIAITYNVRRASKKNSGKDQQKAQSPQMQIGQRARQGAGVSMRVGDAYVLIEEHKDLLEHEVKSSNRDPFVSTELEEPPVEDAEESTTENEETPVKEEITPPALENVEISQHPDPASSTLMATKDEEDRNEDGKEEESSQKPEPQTLDIKGIMSSSLGKCVIVNNGVFSAGDYIGNELLVEVKSDSIVLEGEGGRRELKLKPKQASTSVEVRRSRK